MKRWLYRWIEWREYIPRWVRWIYRKAHWCPEMDEMLILDNAIDCFCGYSDQPMVICPTCGQASERRFTTPDNTCLNCIPLEIDDLC